MKFINELTELKVEGTMISRERLKSVFKKESI